MVLAAERRLARTRSWAERRGRRRQAQQLRVAKAAPVRQVALRPAVASALRQATLAAARAPVSENSSFYARHTDGMPDAAASSKGGVVFLMDDGSRWA